MPDSRSTALDPSVEQTVAIESGAPARIVAPVRAIAPDPGGVDAPREGAGLCLSGGGYRAMLYHLGAIYRLNELGLLPSLQRISSVSGGSITAGVLGLRWKALTFDHGVATNLAKELGEPVRDLASRTIDVGSILLGVLGPGSVSQRIAAQYDRRLFHGATLQDLPADGEGPRFVLNATSLQTGSLWRFSRPRMGDWQVGEVVAPTTPLSTAVAASSAVPPLLSPLVLKLAPGSVRDTKGTTLHRPPYTERAVLTDGGVYDNLGLETVWKSFRTVFVSDGGAHATADSSPSGFWPPMSIRVLETMDRQVRSLRKRQLIESYRLFRHAGAVPGAREGCYWGIWTDIAEYECAHAMPAPVSRTAVIAATPTRLKSLSDADQERLINWGYASADASLRAFHLKTCDQPPPAFPFSRGVD